MAIDLDEINSWITEVWNNSGNPPPGRLSMPIEDALKFCSSEEQRASFLASILSGEDPEIEFDQELQIVTFSCCWNSQ